MPDHDFPIPGYLLNVSGYMILEEESVSDPMNLQNSSVHDQIEVSNDDNEGQYDLHRFTHSKPMSLFEALVDQCKINLNIFTSAMEIKDCILDFVKNNTEYFIPSHFDGTEDELKTLFEPKEIQITYDILNVLLPAMSLHCCCKVVLFENEQFNVISHEKVKSPSPIFFKRNDDGTFSSL